MVGCQTSPTVAISIILTALLTCSSIKLHIFLYNKMILTYHKVKIFPQKDPITTGFLTFLKQMLSLRKRKVVYLDSYNPANVNQVVITFDDGYKEVLKYAFPVLKFFNYPFEVFLVADFFAKANGGGVVIILTGTI